MSRQLLQKNTLFLLKWLPVVLLGFCVLFYFLMRYQAHHMQEKQLELKNKNVWNAFILSGGNLNRHIKGEYDINDGELIPVNLLDEPRDTSVWYNEQRKLLPFAILTKQVSWNNKIYQVSGYVSSTEISHLIIKVFITEAIILLVLLLSIIFLNRMSSGLLWKPFFITMKKVKEYDINRSRSVDLADETGTTEFNDLNKAISILIGNINASFDHQKQFVENASHEMQTPLAIIRSRVELLTNQPALTENVATILGDITDANNRLTQLNRTLLLLAKIENNQFPETEDVNISLMVDDIIEMFRNLYEKDFPIVTIKKEEPLIIKANPSLVEILLSNIIKNAVIHNTAQGQIKVTIENMQLLVENTGPPLQGAPEEMFERFKKGSDKTKTTGLGLALVKQICYLYGYQVLYQYSNRCHKIKVDFI
jgi:signal transduction histidine kinase